MKTQTFTSGQIGKWLAVFYQSSTKEEYQNKLQAIRCIFEAEKEPQFWSEVCEALDWHLEKAK